MPPYWDVLTVPPGHRPAGVKVKIKTKRRGDKLIPVAYEGPFYNSPPFDIIPDFLKEVTVQSAHVHENVSVPSNHDSSLVDHTSKKPTRIVLRNIIKMGRLSE